jgi:hypothetical protein
MHGWCGRISPFPPQQGRAPGRRFCMRPRGHTAALTDLLGARIRVYMCALHQGAGLPPQAGHTEPAPITMWKGHLVTQQAQVSLFWVWWKVKERVPEQHACEALYVRCIASKTSTQVLGCATRMPVGVHWKHCLPKCAKSWGWVRLAVCLRVRAQAGRPRWWCGSQRLLLSSRALLESSRMVSATVQVPGMA